MKRKKVLIVNNLLGYYGAENVLVNMVNNMNVQKYDITVITLRECDRKTINSHIKYKYIFSGKSGLNAKVENKLKLCMGYKQISKIYCSGYDVAIAFKMGECSKLVGYCDAPIKYCWIHSNVSEVSEPYSYSFQDLKEEKNFLKRFDLMIAVSNSCKKSFQSKYGNEHRIKVIYNPVDVKKINFLAEEQIPKNEKNIFDDDVPIIGAVARIDPEKGIDRLIYIAQQLKNENIKFKMIIIGDGLDYEKYLKISTQRQLPIYMLGFKDNPYKYIKEFDLFICSSVSESFSLVVNEALSLNIPIISTKCGGPEEVLDHGKYGILTDNDEKSLFVAVKDFLLGKKYKCEPYKRESIKEFLLEIDNLLSY